MFISLFLSLYYDNVQSLGLTMNSILNLTDTVLEICNKVIAGVHTLKRCNIFLPMHIKLLENALNLQLKIYTTVLNKLIHV